MVCPWRRRSKRSRPAAEKPGRPDELWVTERMQLVIGGVAYYLICFMDEYSRYIVHHQVLAGLDGQTVSLAAQTATERLPKEADGVPVIQSDNGSGYVSWEFLVVPKENELGDHRITPHCPAENGRSCASRRRLTRQ